MKKKSFKYNIGERVFILGITGVCQVSGRGHMEFISGGHMPWYSLEGAHTGFHPESSLITPEEFNRLGKSKI